MASILPPEIITEILTRLPVKSLIRFLCVCKSWYSHIKSPTFIKLHLNQTIISNSESYLILCRNSLYIAPFNSKDTYNSLSFSDLDHPLEHENIDVIGCCNGLICIANFAKTSIYLYNPLTKYCRKLPVKPTKGYESFYVVYGFGYDSVTDDYKVFRFYRMFNNGGEFTDANAFSFKDHCCKPVENFCESDIFLEQYGVYLNEAIYYLVYKKLDLSHNIIAKFDFRTDSLLPVECPDFDAKSRANVLLVLSALDGCLCLLVSYYPDGSFPVLQRGEENCLLVRADLWMMGSGKDKGWVRLFSIRDPHRIGITSKICVVVCSKDGTGTRILLEVDGSKLGWYDLGNGSFRTIITCEHPVLWGDSRLCYFSGSLVSLVDDK